VAWPIEAEEVVVAGGMRLVLAAVGACDPVSVPAWFAERFAGLSSETLYARLWVLLDQLGHPPDGIALGGGRDGDEVIVAFTAEGVLVGIARCLCAEESSSAELALAIAPSWRCRGIMAILLERLGVSARAAGIKRLTASSSASASGLMWVMAGMGHMTVTPARGGVAELSLELA
jgi:GNAT superfamily N-acetyltransferase